MQNLREFSSTYLNLWFSSDPLRRYDPSKWCAVELCVCTCLWVGSCSLFPAVRLAPILYIACLTLWPCGVASSPHFFYYFLAVTITSKEPTLGWLLKWKKFIQDILERNEICWMNWCRRNNLLCYNELTCMCVCVYIVIYCMYVLHVYGDGVSKDLKCKDSFYLSWYYNFTHNQCTLHVGCRGIE